MAALRSRRLGWIGVALMVVVLALLPLLDRETMTNARLLQFTQLFMLVTMASNWNLTGGFTGYVDFGHAVFFGLGAYGTGVMMAQLDWAFVPAVAVGAVAAAVFALLIGSATLRLRGPYFSIAMLGTFVAMREFVRVIKPVTGGGEGLSLPPYLNRPLFYYITLVLVVIVVSGIWWLRRTQFGASLIAIREDEVGAEMRGINTTRHKIVVFVVAAMSTGIVGGLWAYQFTFIDPDIVFVEARTVDAVMATMLGGLGLVAGPVVGGVALYWLRDVVWSNFLQYHLIVQGVLLIFIVLYFPSGILGRLGSRRATTLSRVWNRALGRGDPEDTEGEQAAEPEPGSTAVVTP